MKAKKREFFGITECCGTWTFWEGRWSKILWMCVIREKSKKRSQNMAYMVGTSVNSDGEGESSDNGAVPATHISSKLTERLSLRDNRQAGYHPWLEDFKRWKKLHESLVQRWQPKRRDLAEPPCSTPWLVLICRTALELLQPSLAPRAKNVRLYVTATSGTSFE